MRKIISFFEPMIIPTATQQEKKINTRTRTVYQDARAQAAKNKIRAHLVKHIPGEPFSGPVQMVVTWAFMPEKKYSAGDWKATIPDLDNMQKALQDIMTELGFWKNDSQVCQLITSKIYSDKPGMTIVIRELEKAFCRDENDSL